METPEALTELEARGHARAYTMFVWAFLFMVFLHPGARIGPVRVVMMPAAVGWVLMLCGLRRLRRTEESRQAARWAALALLFSLPFVFQLDALRDQKWYVICVLGAQALMSVCAVLFVFPLMAYTAELARALGSRVVAGGARGRAVMFVASLLMPYAVQLVAAAVRRAPDPGLLGFSALVPLLLGALLITAVMSYMGSVVRLCSTSATSTTRSAPGGVQEAAQEMSGEPSEPAAEEDQPPPEV